MSLREKIDIRESFDGDLILENGDIKDTSDNPADTYYQIIHSCLNTPKRDCKLYPDFGVNLSQYQGVLNTKDTGKSAAVTIKKDLSSSTELYSTELDITPFPLGKDTIAFKIDLKTVDSNSNGLIMAYDSSNDIVKTLNEGNKKN